jgi:hypothetical protein
MTHTFWYSGILIGESDFEDPLDDPRRMSGTFRPTAYGEEIFPRLTGVLSAGHALKALLDAKGLDPDEMDGDQIDELFETSEAAQKIVDIGRAISEVETRAPDGRRIEFKSIAFIDTLEIPRLLRELTGETSEASDEPPDGARYVVSGTLLDELPDAISDRLAGSATPGHSSVDN